MKAIASCLFALLGSSALAVRLRGGPPQPRANGPGPAYESYYFFIITNPEVIIARGAVRPL